LPWSNQASIGETPQRVHHTSLGLIAARILTPLAAPLMLAVLSSFSAGFPGKKNFPFLKTLNLRTIVYLCPEEYPEANLNFLTGIHVQVLQFGVAGNKVSNTEHTVTYWSPLARYAALK
jgi:hypothetical protein